MGQRTPQRKRSAYEQQAGLEAADDVVVEGADVVADAELVLAQELPDVDKVETVNLRDRVLVERPALTLVNVMLG